MLALDTRTGRVTVGIVALNKSRRIHKKDRHEQRRKQRQKSIKKAKFRAKALASQPKISAKKGIAKSISTKSQDVIDTLDRNAWGLKTGNEDG